MLTKLLAGIPGAVTAPYAVWVRLSGRQKASLSADGATQEAKVVIRERYLPATILARRGVPLRIAFVREEEDSCSQRVIFPDFRVNHFLPAWKTTCIELTPDREGEFLFTCEMGMYQGALIVSPDRSLLKRMLPRLNGRRQPPR